MAQIITFNKTKRIKACFALILLVILLLVVFHINPKIIKQNSAEKSFRSSRVSISKPTFRKDKWIVVTTINQPTRQIIKLSKIKNFQLLVVGDLKTPSNWSYKNVIYLSIDKQRELGYRSFETTPFNAYTRKNIGYLYAIHHGAQYIYDTDDDNAPIVNINQFFQLDDLTYGITFPICTSNITVINPYAHFGQPHLWPRGYPLNEINKIHDNDYICKLLKTSSVQQGLVNGDPDVDAIYRLTNSINYRPIYLEFDSTAPSIQLPIGRLSPYNSQNTFFRYAAFWSLYLPSTVTFRLTDIWRSYWSQRLLWLIEDTLTFHGPNAVQIRNVHSYIKDFEEEIDMYEQTDRLVTFLLDWSCNLNEFNDCMMKLTEDMIEKGHLKSEELEGMRNWIEDLNEIGYSQPRIVDKYRKINKKDCSIDKDDNRRKSDYYLETQQFNLRFTPNFQANSQSLLTMPKQNFTFIEYENQINRKFLKKLCKGHLVVDNQTTNNENGFNRHSNGVTLLIALNHDSENYFDNILLLKHMYFKYFKNIVFCGPNMAKYFKSYKSDFTKVYDEFTFIEFDTKNGFYQYYCMKKAIDIGFNINDGILLISDDLLIKPWNFIDLDRSKIWYTKNEDCWVNDDTKDILARVPEFKKKFGDNPILQTWKDLKKTPSPFIQDYYKMLKTNFQNKNVVCRQKSNGFYLPKSKIQQFYYLIQFFYQNQVYLEFTVPMILFGIENKENIQLLEGRYYSPGQFPIDSYDNHTHYEHPTDLTVLKKDLGKLCKTFIKEFLLN